jgi:proteasome assembly chaperone (PAC2) family protein
MADQLQLTHPRFVAVWPGMGHVALNAGVYLLAKLGMNVVAEYEASGLFDVDHVEVKEGLIQPLRQPRNRFFVWKDPAGNHDLVAFVGEAQPPVGKYAFCRQLIAYARELSVERVFTFAAMATQMHPQQPSRVFGAATDEQGRDELSRLELEVLADGNISGLNGVLLGVAAENGLPGTCLLGEMPHIFSQLPFPKASLAILEVFASLGGIELDLAELAERSAAVEEQLVELLSRVETLGEPPTEETDRPEPPEEPKLKPADEQRIETLFGEAKHNRSKAFELKQELDRLGVFKDYEDRFLDLFKKVD